MENYSISSALHLFVAFCQTCKMSERFNYFAGLPVTVTQKKNDKSHSDIVSPAPSAKEKTKKRK
jgi:hypothetical protein